jgi:hypothetical protein
MKKIYLIAVIAVAFASCKKSELLPGDNGCITQIKRENFNINPADSLTAIHLFQQNKMNYSNLAFERIILNDTIGQHVYAHIFATQILNGLEVMSGNAGYHFLDGVYQSTLGKVYGTISLDNRPHLSLPQLRALFMSEAIDKQGISATYRDSCVTAQFGYYDLNAGTGDESTNMVKAWRIELKGNTYPIAVFRDDNGGLIAFDSGIRTFN